MDDKELVEVWRAQFQRLHKTNSIYGFEMRHGEYIDDDIESHWRVFLLAKLSQPVIELPKPEWFYHADNTMCETCSYSADEVNDRLTAAGIKYTIGE